ncbi:hypothetical protein ACL02T_12965 [Pseudonocardia sp. RS010]|uniref:hypothetical protein n=1 Tax=Pseudonocardia sp. RS010 TaxID=3385979 RepID=UPI0039A3F590
MSQKTFVSFTIAVEDGKTPHEVYRRALAAYRTAAVRRDPAEHPAEVHDAVGPVSSIDFCVAVVTEDDIEAVQAIVTVTKVLEAAGLSLVGSAKPLGIKPYEEKAS